MLEGKTHLNNMLTGQAAQQGPVPGKQTQTEADQSADPIAAGTELAGSQQDAAATDVAAPAAAEPSRGKEGGEGAPAPAAAPATNPSQATAAAGKPGKPGAGTIKVTTGPAGSNPSTSRTTIGVGEKVTFSAQEEGTWRVDQKELGVGQSIEWTAPQRGTVGNVVFEPFLTSPNKNTQASVPVLVLAPSSVAFKKLGGVPVSGPGLAGVGMTTEVTIGPTTVSFGAAEWLELPGPAEGVSGYFAEYVKSGQSLAHKPNASWLPMGASNNDVRDNAWTKDKPKLQHADGTKRWWAGSFHWTIPNHFRVAGGGSQLISYVKQSFVMDEAGAITVTKGGASTTSKPDNQMDGDIQKFPTQKEAMTFLQLHGRAGCIQAVMNYKRNPKADPASVTNLIAALKNVNVELYTFVQCNKTFSWTDPDKVTLLANGVKAKGGETKKLNSGDGREFLFDVNKLLDLGKLAPGDTINLLADVRDNLSSHPHSASLAYPFGAKDVTMQGSDRYTISAYFR